jgi:hypothetical protein
MHSTACVIPRRGCVCLSVHAIRQQSGGAVPSLLGERVASCPSCLSSGWLIRVRGVRVFGG